jgi:phosphomannomutase
MQTPNIKFGTDGWRGIIADDFTYDNVALVAKALHAYLAESGQGQKPLIIGYDRRFGAENYAAHLGNYIASLGQSVLMLDSACPTPVIAFGVLHHQAAGAVVLTASHNPYYYQGLKFIPYFAGPAMPAVTDRITELIQELAPGFTPPFLRLEWAGERINLKEPYFTHIDSLVNVNSLTSGGWTVLYNPMHGVGAGYLDAFLERAGVPCKTINAERDVYFGSCLPDPSPKNLQPLAPLLAEMDCRLLLASDGDADRFGLVDAEGRYFGANQALPMLADYLVRYKHMTGDLVRTVSTSHMLDDVAREHGLKLIETAVGFKYVGEYMRQGALIGGEESGGLSIQGHVPEKDGILASLLMLELVATSGDDWYTLLRDMQKRLGARAYIRIDEELAEERKKRLFTAMKGWGEAKFAGKRIESRNDVDGVKLLFDDGSWVLMRPSGTEPLVRIYIETTAPETLPKLKAAVLEAVKDLAG